jgi:hypothetical protein
MSVEIVPFALAACVFAVVVYLIHNLNGEKFIQIRKSFAAGPIQTLPKSKEDGPNKDRTWGSKIPPPPAR